MFSGFREFSIDVDDVVISGRIGGDGPPLLLLHGFPQTHAMWHRVAPRLAEDFTVVATDLRGYGASGKPATTGPSGAEYSKRRMAQDQLQLMRLLGHDRFSIAGHDRGARCAYRLALDHPEAVQRIAVLDIVPTLDALAATDNDVAMGLWRWYFLAQPHPLPEMLIAAAPDEFYFGRHRHLFAPEALACYRHAIGDPETVRAMCDDYRAMFTHDLRHDQEDAGNRRIASPLLVLWGNRSSVDRWHDVPSVWHRWATDVTARSLNCGHFLPEEAPEDTSKQIRIFFR